MLTLKDVQINYGKSKVINGVNFTMKKSDKVAVLGRNGVGKTTLMKSIIGILKPECGAIKFVDDDITKYGAYERSRCGIAYVAQGREIISDFTVKENLELGGISLSKGEVSEGIERSLKYFPALVPHLNRKGGVLSGGLQQQLAIARALISNPKTLLLDEPTEGIQPNIVIEIAEILNQINVELDLGIVLVEQNLRFARSIADQYILLQKGEVVSSGEFPDLTDEIIKKYLTV